MQHQITDQTRHTAIPMPMEDYIAQELTKIDPIVASFPPDATILRVIFDDGGRAGNVEVQLRLSLPTRMITSRQEGPSTELRSVFDAALSQLRRQLLEHKRQL